MAVTLTERHKLGTFSPIKSAPWRELRESRRAPNVIYTIAHCTHRGAIKRGFREQGEKTEGRDTHATAYLWLL
jgi:hypothetical protein